MSKLVSYVLAHKIWAGVTGLATLAMLATGVIGGLDRSGAVRKPPPALAAEKAIPQIEGKWKVECVYDSSTYKSYEGLRVLYEIGISQSRNEVVINGEKIAEVFEGETRFYTGKGRTNIRGSGSIDVEDSGVVIRIEAAETGALRNDIKTTFRLTPAPGMPNNYQGVFSSDAANSTGRVSAVQVVQEGAGGL